MCISLRYKHPSSSNKDLRPGKLCKSYNWNKSSDIISTHGCINPIVWHLTVSVQFDWLKHLSSFIDHSIDDNFHSSISIYTINVTLRDGLDAYSIYSN